MNKLALSLAALLLAAPLAARADVGLRLGPEVQIAYHYKNGGTHFITDNFPVAANLMLSYWSPGSILSFDVEVSELFVLKDNIGDTRAGTVLRPGIRVSPPVIPLYLRAAVPIGIESPTNGRGTGDVGLRVGAGLTVPFVAFGLYIEGDVETPLGGNGKSAFDDWAFLLSGGLDFRF